MQIKKLGVLSLGTQATDFYIKALDKHQAFELLKTDFDKINALLPKPSKQLEKILKNYVGELISLNVDKLLIPNITLHETIDKINPPLNIIHPLPLSVSAVKQKQKDKVVLFGSIHTMKSPYIKSNLISNNIRVLLPSDADMQFIDAVRRQVYQRKTTKKLLDDFNCLVTKYAQRHAVVIACTELSIVLKSCNANVFDMARLQVKSVIKPPNKYNI